MNVYIKSECRDRFLTPDLMKPEKVFFNGVRVYESDEGPYFHLDDITGSVPEEVKPFVVKCSIKAEFNCANKRTIGTYHFQTARAVLDTGQAKLEYLLKIWGPCLDDVQVLYQCIRAGTIETKQNWDAPQI
jgi:hypothetical protein